jgi:hypothetical protein
MKLFLAVVGYLALLLAGLGLSRLGAGRTVEQVALRTWLERPQREGAAFATDGPVTIEGMTEAVFTPRLPPGLSAPPANGRYLLAAFRAGEGRRLLLAPEAKVAALPHLLLRGVSVTPESIGLPAAALDELARTIPGLDTHLVTGLSWTWNDGPADR